VATTAVDEWEHVGQLLEEPGEPFWSARPFLSSVHQFARARRVSPWAVLGVTLARIIAATPNQVALPPIVGSKASLNLFVGLVGPSGSGKGAAEAAAADLLRLDVRTARVASGEAIAHVFKERTRKEVIWRDDNHAALITVPEIDRLAGQHARQGSTILADLRSAWSGEQLGQVAADATRSLTLEAHQYRLCLVAGIQPERAGVLLDDVDGGTPQRFLWLPATDEDAPTQAPEEPDPLTWTMPSLAGRVTWRGTYMDVCTTARDTIDRARVARLRGDGEALDGHALLCQLKTAAALALSDSRLDVTDDDWRCAAVITRKSASVRRSIVTALNRKKQRDNVARAEAEAARAIHVDNTKTEAATHRVCNSILRRLKQEPATRSDLRKALPSRDRDAYDDAIERLLAAGQIELDDTDTGHGNATGTYHLKGTK
jgi:hypothetical protein